MELSSSILVTGGAGFIGSHFVERWLAESGRTVVNLDALTYAGDPRNLETAAGDARHVFVEGDINDADLVRDLLAANRPRAIVHLAAETHVDRSIRSPFEFVRANVDGTLALLEEARDYWEGLTSPDRERFRFVHVSTDEVFGSIGDADPPAVETTAYAPNNPYAATKAASDFLVRSHHRTYGLPTLTTRGSNTFGPRQHFEKLIPLVIARALDGRPLPIYGDGRSVRDWLYVADHCDGILRVLEDGRPGETYNLAGGAQRTNLEVVRAICSVLDREAPDSPYTPHERLLTFVDDRPGHDRRYALDGRRMREELDWAPAHSFEGGIEETVRWHLARRSGR